MDRSKQGVAPRTCLAAKPSKPRPPPGAARGPGPNGRMSPAMIRPTSPAGQGPPRTQQQRSTSPQMRGSRPGTPNEGRGQMRPVSPGGYNRAPRPLSPGPRATSKRSMSPGPYGPGGAQKPRMPASQRQRSNSVGALNVRDRREVGPGPSRLGPGSPPLKSSGRGGAA